MYNYPFNARYTGIGLLVYYTYIPMRMRMFGWAGSCVSTASDLNSRPPHFRGPSSFAVYNYTFENKGAYTSTPHTHRQNHMHTLRLFWFHSTWKYYVVAALFTFNGPISEKRYIYSLIYPTSEPYIRVDSASFSLLSLCINCNLWIWICSHRTRKILLTSNPNPSCEILCEGIMLYLVDRVGKSWILNGQ